MQGPETRLRKRIVKALMEKYPSGLYLKIHGNRFQNIGVPDLLCCIEGYFVALEIKTERGKVSPAQSLMLDRIKEAKGISAVIRSSDEALEVVKLVMQRVTNV